jgi:hypothetical protein
VVAFLLDVKLLHHLENVLLARGKIVAVGFQCNARVILIMISDSLPVATYTYTILELLNFLRTRKAIVALPINVAVQ